MIDVDSIPDQVLTDIAENLGIEDGDCDEKDLETISQMTATEALDRFLIWNGIQGYTGIILEAVDGLQVAETIAGLRELLKSKIDGDITEVWDAIGEVLSTQGHRNDSTLKLVLEAWNQGNGMTQRALALIKIQEVVG